VPVSELVACLVILSITPAGISTERIHPKNKSLWLLPAGLDKPKANKLQAQHCNLWSEYQK